MLRTTLAAALVSAGVALAGAAGADPWKNESGKTRERAYDHEGGYRYDRDRRWHDEAYDDGPVPRGHLPPAGMCRVWFEDRPPGQQPPPTTCRRALRTDALVIDSRGRMRDAYAQPRYGSPRY